VQHEPVGTDGSFETPLLGRIWRILREEVDPELDFVATRPIPWTEPHQYLAASRVALISTGGLHLKGEPPFEVLEQRLGDPSFRVVPHLTPADQLDLDAAYVDQKYTPADPEVALPMAALDELAFAGDIGEAAPRHLSFCGGLVRPLPGLVASADAALELLAEDAVDAALLIPTCSVCVQTMCLLACELEAGGVPTVCLSLIEELSRLSGAPRTLVVRFPFGAPCGDPSHRELHMAVIREALDLLRTATAPGTIEQSGLAWRRDPPEG
jgi:D-proline reductase (dithiol) PrdB